MVMVFKTAVRGKASDLRDKEAQVPCDSFHPIYISQVIYISPFFNPWMWAHRNAKRELEDKHQSTPSAWRNEVSDWKSLPTRDLSSEFEIQKKRPFDVWLKQWFCLFSAYFTQRLNRMNEFWTSTLHKNDFYSRFGLIALPLSHVKSDLPSRHSTQILDTERPENILCQFKPKKRMERSFPLLFFDVLMLFFKFI